MATADALRNDTPTVEYGVVLQVCTADDLFDLEVQRAPDSGGSPDVGSALTVYEALSIPLSDTRAIYDWTPDQNATYWYRFRSVRTNWNDGDWTDWYAVKSGVMPIEEGLVPLKPCSSLGTRWLWVEYEIDRTSQEAIISWVGANEVIEVEIWEDTDVNDEPDAIVSGGDGLARIGTYTVTSVTPGYTKSFWLYAYFADSDIVIQKITIQYGPGGDTDVPGDPSSLAAYYSRWGFTVTWTGDADARWYELRRNTSVDWDTATFVTRFEDSPGFADRDTLPTGKYYLLLKAGNDIGYSANYIYTEVVSLPLLRNPKEYIKDQDKKRFGGEAFGGWGAVYDRLGVTQIFDDDGVLVGLAYDDDLGTLVNVRQPVEGAAQRNFELVIASLTHGETYTAPTGRTIRSARYRSGGLSVQGASVWGTKAEVDADTNPWTPGTNATDSPPTSYAQAPAFDIDGASMEARLLLKERITSVIYTNRSTAFLDNQLTFAGDETGVSQPSSGVLPAHDGTYNTEVTGQITSNKSGTYQIRLTLMIKTNGGSYVQKDEQTIEGNLDDLNISRTLSAYISGWPSGGIDNAKVVVEDVVAAGNWALTLTVGALSWVQADSGSPIYASMTPNGESCDIEVLLESTS